MGRRDKVRRLEEDMRRADISERIDTSSRDILLPCSYGGGDCISSYWSGNQRIGFCLRARQVGRLTQRKLDRAGCPETRRRKCKYADGENHYL